MAENEENVIYDKLEGGIIATNKLLNRPVKVEEIRKNNLTPYGKSDLYIFRLKDGKRYGFFNKNIRRFGVEDGDTIKLGEGKTKNGAKCYIITEKNGKPVENST